MAQKAMLINYRFCTGCRTCEVACQQEHGFDPEASGITLHSQGPFPIDGKRWNWNWFAAPSDLCDGCSARIAKGKLPSCQHHCQARVIEIGEVAELSSKMGGGQVLYCIG